MSRKGAEDDLVLGLAMTLNAIVLKHGGQLDIKTLKKELKRGYQIETPRRDILDLLKECSNIFDVTPEKAKTSMVISKTVVSRIKICIEFTRRKGNCHCINGECNGLHICKFFLLSDSCKYGPDCCFGHEFHTKHNRNVLMKHFLHSVFTHVTDFREVFCQIENRNFTTMPDTCKFYNTSKTCRNDNCRNLHLCRHFLEGSCKFGGRCKRSHEICGPSVREILVQYGFDVSEQKDKLLRDLKTFYTKKVSGEDTSDGFNSVCDTDHDSYAGSWNCLQKDVNGNDDFPGKLKPGVKDDSIASGWNPGTSDMARDESVINGWNRDFRNMSYGKSNGSMLNREVPDFACGQSSRDMEFDESNTSRWNHDTNIGYDESNSSRWNHDTNIGYDESNSSRWNHDTNIGYDESNSSRWNHDNADIGSHESNLSRWNRNSASMEYDDSNISKWNHDTTNMGIDELYTCRRNHHVSHLDRDYVESNTPYSRGYSRDRSSERISSPYSRGRYSRDRSKERISSPYSKGHYSRDQSRERISSPYSRGDYSRDQSSERSNLSYGKGCYSRDRSSERSSTPYDKGCYSRDLSRGRKITPYDKDLYSRNQRIITSYGRGLHSRDQFTNQSRKRSSNPSGMGRHLRDQSIERSRRSSRHYDSSPRSRSRENSRGRLRTPHDQSSYLRNGSQSRSTENSCIRYREREYNDFGTDFHSKYPRSSSEGSGKDGAHSLNVFHPRCKSTHKNQSRRIFHEGHDQFHTLEQTTVSCLKSPAEDEISSSAHLAKQQNDSSDSLSKGQDTTLNLSFTDQENCSYESSVLQDNSLNVVSAASQNSPLTFVELGHSPNWQNIITQIRKNKSSSETSFSECPKSSNVTAGSSKNLSETSLTKRHDSTSNVQGHSETSSNPSPTATELPSSEVSTSMSHLPKEPTRPICIQELQGKCMSGSDCQSHHKSMIYQWQWKGLSNEDWTDFDKENNLKLEQDFCQVANMECYFNMR